MTEPAMPGAGDEETRGPRVVVGVDCSAGSRAALLFALEDAARRGVPVEAVTAYRPPEYWMDFYATGSYPVDQLRSGAEDQVRTFVEQTLPDGPQPPPPVRVRAIMGTATDVLIHEAHDADLLVIGSRGHGGFGRVLLGSTSMQCAQHATCPVTVVHSPETHHERRLHLRRHRRPEASPPAPVG
jgi:nucleotide-binding universal stress UspA family protein